MLSLAAAALAFMLAGFALCALYCVAIVVLTMTGHGTLVRKVKRPHVVLDRHGRTVECRD